MTDQFIQDDSNNQQGADDSSAKETDLISNPQGSDQGPAGGGEGPADTKDPQYQISKMQQRIQDKDDFIGTLQQENQQTREMYANLEERMQNMESISEVLSKHGKQQDVDNQDTSLDENELVGKVIENLNKQQAEEYRQENFDTVVGTLKQQFGEANVNNKVKEIADDNGMSVDDMVETAKKSPKAFYKLTGIQQEASQQKAVPGQPTRSKVNSESIPENGQKDYAYYARLMREDPREYWKPETQREFRKLFTQNN